MSSQAVMDTKITANLFLSKLINGRSEQLVVVTTQLVSPPIPLLRLLLSIMYSKIVC